MDSRRILSRSETSGSSVTGLFRETDRNLSSPNGRLLNSHWCSPSESHSPLTSFYKSPIVSTPNRRTLGPLLASTHFNYNVSTYMDSKSPGLTERLVQYNNNTQECRATHQAKYGTPGVFPVVHLFKKNTLIRTPSKVTVHIGLQDSSLNSMEYSTIPEDLTPHGNGGIHYDHHEGNLGSHSVLDALKEISRKRIQSGDPCLQPHDSCKRQRRECYTEQAKEVSSSSNTTNLPVQLPEVPCVMDPITASLTSSRPYLVQPTAHIKKKRKRAVQEKKSQHHVETQTDKLLEDTINKKISNSSITNTDASSSLEKVEDGFEKSSTSPQEIDTQIFGNSPIETNKKAKLAILLSALTSPESTSPLYKQETLIKNKSITGSTQIKVTSIISPQNKPKHNKHVTFAIPEKENMEDVPIIAKPNVSSNVSHCEENKEASNENLATTITTETLEKPESTSNAQILPKPVAVSISLGNTLVPTTPASLQPPVDMYFNKPEPTLFINKSSGKEQGFVTTAPSLESLPLTKPSGFKFDFKDNETTNKSNASTLSESSTSFKLPFSSENFISTGTSSSNSVNGGLTSIVPPTNVSAPLGLYSTVNVNPQTTNMNFNYGDSLKQNSSASNTTMFNSKINNAPNYNTNTNSLATTPNFSFSSSQFGGNPIVTSAFGTNMVLSTDIGASTTTKTITSPMSLPTTTCNISSVPIFAVSQPQTTQPFSINTSYASGFGFNTTMSALPTTSSGAFSFATNTTTGYSVPTTKLPPYSNNNSSVAPTSTVFGTPLNKISNSPATSASGHLTNPFNSSMFANNSGISGQFGPRSASQPFGSINQNTALGESAVKLNPFNTTVSLQTSNFGVRESNTTANTFNAFGSTSQQKNSIFDSTVSAMPSQSGAMPSQLGAMPSQSGVMPSQSGAFTFGTSSATSLPNPTPGIFSFGGQNTPLTTEKFDLPGSSIISSSLNATPNTVFGSGAPPVFGSAANPFSVSANTSFNPLVHSNPVTPKFDSSGRIFSIGAGTTYSKSRTQLKARRRT